MLEREIDAYLKKRVIAEGGELRKVKWIGRRGAPDRLVMLPFSPGPLKIGRVSYPRCAWVETKRPGKKAEAHQYRDNEKMRSFGLIVLVLDTKEKIDAYIDEGKMP